MQVSFYLPGKNLQFLYKSWSYEDFLVRHKGNQIIVMKIALISNWSYQVDKDGRALIGNWGNCDSIENELGNYVMSNSGHTCSKSRFHICTAKSNYGAITVDLENRKVKMSIRTPEEEEEAYHEIFY